MFLEAPPDPRASADLHSGAGYFANPRFGAPEEGGYHGYRDYLRDRDEHAAKFARIMTGVEELRAPGDLLDVGAGPGLLLATARNRGWRGLGLDLNPWAARWATDELGVEVRTGTLEEAGLPDASFDAVLMLDFLEHVARPARTLGEAARVARPGAALAVVTPDAASPVSRALGARWPEAQRAPEHVVLFSARGLGALLRRTGWEPVAWHSIGKESTVSTLLADVLPAAPGPVRGVQRLIGGGALARRVVEIDPRTKLCLYARKAEGAAQAKPSRVPRRPRPRAQPAAPERAILEDLELLAGATRFCDWVFDQYADAVRGRVAEVGAGIGTFSRRILAADVRELVAVEPDPACAAELRRSLAGDRRLAVAAESLPGSPALAAGGFDAVVCQNVLEHVPDHAAAVRAMSGALRPGGELALLVPAGPRLYGALDVAYGHERRYTRAGLRALVEAAGLELLDLRGFNLLAVPGWWWRGRRDTGKRIGRRSLALYDALVPAWRRIEDRLGPPVGLSLVVRARRPAQQ
jgi:2-polyprenyl-3-methyl-5-hydroxy-6-metoxy-1,4-benzoquinol methylase